MAGAGYKLFNTGDVLLASEVNTYLMQQTVMVFADATARTTALSGVLAEGMVSYLQDTNVVEIYNGSAWASLDDPNAIQNTIVDAKGDLISATADNTPARLASSGNNGDVLTIDTSTSTGLKWAAAAAGGKVLQVVQDTTTTQESTGSTSFVDTALSLAITPSAASSKILCIVNANAQIQKGSDTYIEGEINLVRTSTEIAKVGSAAGQGTSNEAIFNRQNLTITYLDSPNTTSATTYKVQMRMVDSSADIYLSSSNYLSSLTLIEIGA